MNRIGNRTLICHLWTRLLFGFGLTRLVTVVPLAVVHGVLTAIGIWIIRERAPSFLGFTHEAIKEFRNRFLFHFPPIALEVHWSDWLGSTILIFLAMKLCADGVLRFAGSVGAEQVFVFAVTVLASLAFGFLVGVLVGMLHGFAVDYLLYRCALISTVSRMSDLPTALQTFLSLIKSPVSRQEFRASEYRIVLGGPLVSFNAYLLADALRKAPADVSRLVIQVGPETGIVDQTACELLQAIVATPSPWFIEGLDDMTKLTAGEKCSSYIAPGD